MPAESVSINWKDLQSELRSRRETLLSSALAETKAWCPAPSVYVRGKTPSDQHWLRLFSSDSDSVSGSEVQRFLVTYNLARWVTWNTDSVAVRVEELRCAEAADPSSTVSVLADELSKDIKKGIPSKQTSAASKLAFFTLPSGEYYIWDQFAMRATRCRDWIREGARTSPRRFDRPYALRASHDYKAFHKACSLALKEESGKSDFAAAAKELREHFASADGPFSSRSDDASDSFIERRFLDKLLFMEGQHLARLNILSS